jgi:hypothetical protein
MKIFKILLRVELIALVGLLILSVLLAVYSAVEVYLNPPNVLTPYETATAVFVYSLTIGGVAVIVFGAPIYTILQLRNKASWIFVLLLGVVPGLAILAFDITIGAYALFCGMVVAITTHIFYKGTLKTDNET